MESVQGAYISIHTLSLQHATTAGQGFMEVDRQKWRNIALDDMSYYLVDVLNKPRAYWHCYDVGCDDILTNDQRSTLRRRSSIGVIPENLIFRRRFSARSRGSSNA